MTKPRSRQDATMTNIRALKTQIEGLKLALRSTDATLCKVIRELGRLRSLVEK